MRSIDEIQALIRERSSLPAADRERVIAKRFAALPRRLQHAAAYWALEAASVLDVGCSYGHCLVHFGPGSVGIDNVAEHVDFCCSLGLDARLADVDEGLDEVEDGAFDVVWISDVLEHLDAPRLLLRRVQPKLKPGGRVIALVSVLPRSRLARLVFRGHGWFDADVHHYQFTAETARHLVERSGYVVEQVVPHLLPRRFQPLNRLLLPFAPVIFVSACPDPAANALAAAAEGRNKPERAVVTIGG